MEYSIKEIHETLLEMMIAFHKMCIENNITYYLIGGTCLGAVRHKGFIPWDDDVDVGVPREDYDKLRDLPQSAIPNGYELKYYGNTPGCPIHYIKMIKTDSTLIENCYRNYVEGLYLDVFPIDGAKSPSVMEIVRRNRIWILHAMIMNHSMTSSKSNLLKAIFKKWSEIKDVQKMHEKLDRLLKEVNFDDSDIVGNYLGCYKHKEFMDKRIFGKPTKIVFEGETFLGPEMPHEFLTNIYGDYMQLPPKEEQVLKHNYYYLDLNHSYRDFK